MVHATPSLTLLVCEHAFVGAAGSTHGAFQRAVERGNVLLALNLARELGTVSLEDALQLTALLARAGDNRYNAAAVRWVARLATEKQVSLEDVTLAAAALCAMRAAPERVEAEATLLHLSRRPRRAHSRQAQQMS